MIGTPRDQVTTYLELVAGISRLLRGEGTRAALMAARTGKEFRAQLARRAGQ